MIESIELSSEHFNNYLSKLKNRLFKILPLFEEKNDGLYLYIDSLCFELYGLQYVVNGIEQSNVYIGLLATLESLLDESIIHEKGDKFIRSEILRIVNVVDKLKEEGE
jgi:hypothetical protein